MSANSQLESLSVDETNALRIKLGLKPLYNDEPTPTSFTAEDSTCKTAEDKIKYSADTEVKYVAPVIESKRDIEIEKRLNERLQRQARSELIKGPTIAQSFIDDPLDPLAWTQAQRLKQKQLKEQKPVLYSDDESSPTKHSHQLNPDDSSMDVDNETAMKIVHDYKSLDTNSILTLCDTSILEAQEEMMEDVDYLQSIKLVEKEKLEKKLNRKKDKNLSYEDYVAQAMEADNNKDILEKYDEVIQENSTSGFKNFISGFFIKKHKKPNAYDNNNDEIKITIGNEGNQSAADNTVYSNGRGDYEFSPTKSGYSSAPDDKKNGFIKKAIPKISKRGKVPDWDELFTDASAPPAPGYSVPSAPDPPSPLPIVKPRRAVEYDANLDDMDEMLYQQLTKQRRIENRNSKNQFSTSVKSENIKQEQYEAKYEISQATEFCKSVQPATTSSFIPKTNINNNYSSRSSTHNVTRINGTGNNINIPLSGATSLDNENGNTNNSSADLNPMEETPLDCGIANTLKYLKTKGQLEPVKSEPDEIKLNYINKYGKTMTPKEAFRELSYSFHGKTPGKNKQAKRLRKIEMELKILQNPTNSLPTMRALAHNQKTDKCAHIVLDGGGNPIK